MQRYQGMFCALLLVVLLSGCALAVDHTVYPGPISGIADALQLISSDDDRVVLNEGTYTGCNDLMGPYGQMLGLTISQYTYTTRLVGLGAGATIDCEGNGRAILIQSPTELSNIVFKNGLYPGYYSTGGGALRVSYTSVTVRNCVFLNNSAPMSGGAVSIEYGYGTSVFDSCTFTGNSVTTAGSYDNGGGAISSAFGQNSINITNSVFTNNWVTCPFVYFVSSSLSCGGGHIFLSTPQIALLDRLDIVGGGTSFGAGGAVSIANGYAITISNSVIKNTTGLLGMVLDLSYQGGYSTIAVELNNVSASATAPAQGYGAEAIRVDVPPCYIYNAQFCPNLILAMTGVSLTGDSNTNAITLNSPFQGYQGPSFPQILTFNVEVVWIGGTVSHFYNERPSIAGALVHGDASVSNMQIALVGLTVQNMRNDHALSSVAAGIAMLSDGNITIRDCYFFNFTANTPSPILVSSSLTSGVTNLYVGAVLVVDGENDVVVSVSGLVATDCTGYHGVLVFGETNAEVNSSTIANSRITYSQGGALLCVACSLVSVGLSVVDNAAGPLGGGLACYLQGALMVSQSYFHGNTPASPYQAVCSDCGCCTDTPTLTPVVINIDYCAGFPNAPCNYTCTGSFIRDNTKIGPICDGGSFSDAGSCQSQPCPEPPPIPNMLPFAQGQNFHSGDIAPYVCAATYALNGGPLTCGGDATAPRWTGDTPTCNNGACVNITAPGNGSVSAGAASVGQTVTYSCNALLMVVGSATRTCEDGTGLSGTQPTCEPVKCDVSANNLLLADCPKSNIAYNTTCNMTCPSGYSGALGGFLTCLQVGSGGAPGTFLPGGAPVCVECVTGTYAAHGDATCTACVHGTTLSSRATSIKDCLCDVNYYETEQFSGVCVDCPVGGQCYGGHEQPVSASGFFPSNGVFVACTPPEACAGNNTCSPAYTGLFCGACAVNFYRLNNLCIACPGGGNWKLIVGGVGAALVSLGLVKASKPVSGQVMNVKFASPTIAFSFAQVTASFAFIQFHWPAQILKIYEVFSSLNLNIELANPECAIKLTFFDKLKVQLLIPLVILGLFILVVLILILKSAITDCSIPGLFSRNAYLTVMDFGSGFLLFMTIAYMFLAQATAQFFSCVQRADGSFTLASAPELYCYQGEWSNTLYLAIFSLLVYVAGVPLFIGAVFLVLRKRRGTEAAIHHPLTNFFVGAYEDAHWYWGIVVMGRKFAIVLLTAVFITNPSVQALSVILVLFVSAAAQVGVRPFKWDKHDIVELFSLVASMLVLFSGIVSETNNTDKVKNGVANVAVAMTILASGVVGLCFIFETVVSIYVAYKARQTGGPIRHIYRGHTAPCSDVVVANQFTIVSSSGDKTIKVWNVKTNDVQFTLEAAKKPVVALAVVKTNYVLSASSDGVVKLWNVQTGACLGVQARDLRRIRCMETSADGSLLAIGNSRGTLYLFHAPTLAKDLPEQVGDLDGDEVFYVEPGFVKKTCQTLPCCLPKVPKHEKTPPPPVEKEIVIYSLAQEIKKAHPGGIRCLSVQDNITVFTGGADGYARRWTPLKATSTGYWRAHSGEVTAISVHNGIMFTGSDDATIRAVDIEENEVVGTYPGHHSVISHIEVDEQTGLMLTSSWDLTIKLWEVESGDYLQTLIGHTLAVNRVRMRHYKGLIPNNHKTKDAKNVLGIAYSASDDGSIHAFEVNAERNETIEDPLEVVTKTVLRCCPEAIEEDLSYSSEDDDDDEEKQLVSAEKSVSDLTASMPTAQPEIAPSASNASLVSGKDDDDKDDKDEKNVDSNPDKGKGKEKETGKGKGKPKLTKEEQRERDKKLAKKKRRRTMKANTLRKLSMKKPGDIEMERTRQRRISVGSQGEAGRTSRGASTMNSETE